MTCAFESTGNEYGIGPFSNARKKQMTSILPVQGST
jgi:hypothetical protein